MDDSTRMKIMRKFQDTFLGSFMCLFTKPICTISTLLLCGLLSALSSGLFLSDFSYESFMAGVCMGACIIFFGTFLTGCIYFAALMMLPKEEAQKLFNE